MMNRKICILLLIAHCSFFYSHAQQPPTAFKTNVLKNEAVLRATCAYFAPALKEMKGKYEGYLWCVDSVHNSTLHGQLKKLDIFMIYLCRNIILDFPFSEDSTIIFEKWHDFYYHGTQEFFVYETRNKPFRRQLNKNETLEMIKPGFYYYTVNYYPNLNK